MSKFFLFLFLFCLPLFCFGQNRFQGFYQAQFINIFGDVKIIRAELEVRADNSMVGKIDSAGGVKIFQGQATAKGKFELRAAPENNAVTIIKGEFPNGKTAGRISLVRRVEQKEDGGKSVSENGINGSITKVAPPVELKDAGIIDDGKTRLWFQHANPLFGKEWIDYPATVKKNAGVPNLAYEVLMKMKNDNAERRFRFRVVVRKDGQKLWRSEDLEVSIYEEQTKSADGKEGFNYFDSTNDENAGGGRVEIIGESETEMIFKITNLPIKNMINDNHTIVNGYIHAAKTN